MRWLRESLCVLLGGHAYRAYPSIGIKQCPLCGKVVDTIARGGK